MPVKKRTAKARTKHITHQARARWRMVQGIKLAGNGAGIVLDDALADALGVPALIWHPDLAGLVDALNEEQPHAA